jgi:hypothetical protein
MGNIVIIGAGPVGTTLAIELAKLGINVRILEKRGPDAHTRPGFYDSNVIEFYQKILGYNLPCSNLEIAHMKDLERDLDKIATQYGVKIEKYAFKDFSNDKKSIIVTDPETNKDEIIPADYVFDCSGSKAVVINAINTKMESDPPFKKVVIKQNLIENHLLYYGALSPEDAEVFENRKRIFNTEENLKQLKKFGWNHTITPFFMDHFFGESKSKKLKYCLYMETPENLDPSQYKDYVNLLASLHCGKSVNFEDVKSISKKGHSKPVTSAFTVNPAKLDTLYFENDQYPIIFPMGNSYLEEIDYRLGSALKYAVLQIIALTNSLEISTEQKTKKHTLNSINFEEYEDILNILDFCYQNDIEVLHDIQTELINASKNKVLDSNDIKKGTEKADVLLNNIEANLYRIAKAMNYRRQASEAYNKAINIEPSGKNLSDDFRKKSDLLIQSFELYKNYLKELSENKIPTLNIDLSIVNDHFLSIAKQLMNGAAELHNNILTNLSNTSTYESDLKLVSKCLQTSLSIYNEFFSDEYTDEKAKINSKLTVVEQSLNKSKAKSHQNIATK